MYKFKEDNMKVPCYVWAKENEIEQGAIDQIKNASSLPFVFHHTVLCPDAHLGYGAPIGGVMASKGYIVPNFVGLDIGCGMCAVKTSLTDIDTETLKKIMSEIRKAIPVGFNHHQEAQDKNLMPRLKDSFNPNDAVFIKSIQETLFALGYEIVAREYDKALKSLGTLGGGNHFIEIQKGDDGHIWIMLHSGSRNLGKQVADHYNNIAKELNAKWHSSIPKEFDLAFLPIDSEEGQSYLREMQYCVDFALANRKLMMDRIIDIFQNLVVGHENPETKFEPMINIAHNYAKMENHFGSNVMVHRKGATLARKDTIGIIPGSQGTSSYIVKGLGNEESFMSCSHGAGRCMGRKQAQRELNLKDEIKMLNDQGIIHSIRGEKDLDEAPSSYKNIEVVMENQKDLVKILVELKPLGVVKG